MHAEHQVVCANILSQIHVSAGELSGGEKARVALAAFALVPCNVLLLDEASNHLDAQTIDTLTGALQASPLLSLEFIVLGVHYSRRL